MRFLAILSGLCLVFFANIAFAKIQKIKVYRWIDDKGVVTFSEYRPKNNDYVELEVEGDRVRTTARKAGDRSDAGEGLGINVGGSGDAVEELNSQAVQYCNKAKHNLKVLDSFKNVRVLDDKGNPKVLTKEDVEEQRSLANRQVELFCKDPS